jgi:hypothetical protein
MSEWANERMGEFASRCAGPNSLIHSFAHSLIDSLIRSIH